MDENDWEGLGEGRQGAESYHPLCGDLTVGQHQLSSQGMDMRGLQGSFKSLKLNQVRDRWEAMEAQRYAVDHGMFSIPSIRAGGVSDEPCCGHGHRRRAAAVSWDTKFGHAIHIINSLLRAETGLPEAKPFDFSPFIEVLGAPIIRIPRENAVFTGKSVKTDTSKNIFYNLLSTPLK